MMPCRSKREVAPPPPPLQFPSGAAPWWPMAPPPGVGPSGVRPTSESMGHPFPPPGWWSGLPPPPFPPGFGGFGASRGAQQQSQGAIDLEASECDVNYSPPGGLLSYLQSGNASFQVPVSDSSSQHAAPAKKTKKRKSPVIIDDVDGGRKAKRLPYTPEEDQRLVSAWLHNSNDPINGNCKKNESYWADVVADYNITTPVHRKREVKHLKDRFQKIKRWVSMFCGSWKKASSIYTSGQSDDMLKEKALQFYLDDYKEGPFTVIHCWRQLQNEPKWHAILEQSENNKRKLDGEGDMMDSTQENAEEMKRPMGTKTAKKLRNAKNKGNDICEVIDLDEDLKKLAEIQETANKRHEKVLETQERLAAAKIEAAKLRKEAAMMEAYKILLSTDTKDMTDEMKAEHVMAMRTLRERLN